MVFIKNLLQKIIKNNEIISRLINGGLWITAGGVFSKAISLLGTIFLARILGVEDYGKLGVLISTVLSFSMFAGAGMSLTATKYIAFHESNNDYHKSSEIIRLVLFISLIFGLLFSLTLFFTSGFISQKLFHSEALNLPLKLIAPSLIFISFNSAIQGILLGYQKFKQTSLFNIFFGLINYPIIVTLTWKFNLEGGAIGYSISLMIYSFLLFSITFNKLFKKVYSDKKDKLKTIIIKNKNIIINYSFPAIFGGALVAPILWTADIIVANSDNGFESLGFFQAGNRIKELIIFVPSILSAIILPMLTSSLNRKDLFKDILKVNLIVNILISLIIAIPVIIFSKTIMKTFGPGFDMHWEILVIMAVASLLITYNSVIGKVIASNGNMWYGFLFNFSWGVVMISSVYLFVSVLHLGGKGYALAFLLSYFTHSIVQTLYIKNYNKKA